LKRPISGAEVAIEQLCDFFSPLPIRLNWSNVRSRICYTILPARRPWMRFDNFSFGSLRIDDSTYEHDVVIDRGEIRDRKKKPSKKFRDDFGHTPLSIAEDIPWKCRQLVIGTGAFGRLPVMEEVKREAKRHKVKLLILPTIKAIEVLRQELKETNAILHVTC
jgi:hypothetical protein